MALWKCLNQQRGTGAGEPDPKRTARELDTCSSVEFIGSAFDTNRAHLRRLFLLNDEKLRMYQSDSTLLVITNLSSSWEGHDSSTNYIPGRACDNAG